MAAAPKSGPSTLIKAAPKPSALVEIAIIAAAGLFVSILLMTYGVDLSPGFF